MLPRIREKPRRPVSRILSNSSQRDSAKRNGFGLCEVEHRLLANKGDEIHCNADPHQQSADADKKEKTYRVGPVKSHCLGEEANNDQAARRLQFALQARSGFSHNAGPFQILLYPVARCCGSCCGMSDPLWGDFSSNDLAFA
jgi:hypothetical protein